MMFTTAGRPRLGITYLEVDGQLARYKIPRHLEVLPELPKTDSGKILKRALRG